MAARYKASSSAIRRTCLIGWFESAARPDAVTALISAAGVIEYAPDNKRKLSAAKANFGTELNAILSL